MTVQYLLVGKPRICEQVAFVMQYTSYAIVEKFVATQNYQAQQIVVCDFKNKRRLKLPTANVIYLDDLCRQLDAEYPREFVVRGGVRQRLKQFWRKHFPLRSQMWLRRLPANELRVSELFLKVLFAKPTNVVCDRLEKVCHVNYDGNFCGCAPQWVLPFGNFLQQDLQDMYHSTLARIIKLSSLNNSYCLCDLRVCQDAKFSKQIPTTLKPLVVNDYPEFISVAIDRTCNLQCASCRKCHYVADNAQQKIVDQLTDKLIATGWLEQTKQLVLAGEGEVFYSPSYRRLLTQDLKRKQISLCTNGTLFNQKNWDAIKDKYDDISVLISIDAATAATYQKLRGGDFNILLTNLKMLGNLRQQQKIKYLQINFVVQKDNYLEMEDFVHLAKRHHVDSVFFTHLNNWGTFDQRTYLDKCLIIKDRYLQKDLYQYLQKPIFKDPIVNLWSLHPYILNSDQRYCRHRSKKERTNG